MTIYKVRLKLLKTEALAMLGTRGVPQGEIDNTW